MYNTYTVAPLEICLSSRLRYDSWIIVRKKQEIEIKHTFEIMNSAITEKFSLIPLLLRICEHSSCDKQNRQIVP